MYEKNMRNLEKRIDEAEEWMASCINLIASENVISERVADVLSKPKLAGKYAERSRKKDRSKHYYYKGTKYIEKTEDELEKHLKLLFGCKNVEIRPISGTLANDIVFSAFVNHKDRVMAYPTNHGGHISHYKHGSLGKYSKKIIPIPLTEDGYHLDSSKTIKLVREYKPSIIVLGKSLFLFPEPISGIKEACNKTGTKIVYDASHVLGLIAGKRFQNPLAEGADIVTGSTHKTFFGTQRGIIFSNMEDDEWIKIEKATFPGALRNHHLNTLTGLLKATYEMLEFGREYAKQTIINAKTLASKLYESGFDVQAKKFGFTESHHVAVDLSRYGGGERAASLLEENNIIINSNMLPFEEQKYCKDPRGARIGVQEMTRFGMKESEMGYIATLISKCLHGKNVREEVIEFRKDFQDIKYCFDS